MLFRSNYWPAETTALPEMHEPFLQLVKEVAIQGRESAAMYGCRGWLTCNKVCENCVDVCPNRANISIKVPGMAMNQVIHVDYMCNECGNCKSFCPYASAPYKDKFTLFASEADMADSTNDGFAVINPETKECKVRLLGQISDCKADDANDKLYEGLRRLICAVIDDYSYLIMK